MPEEKQNQEAKQEENQEDQQKDVEKKEIESIIEKDGVQYIRKDSYDVVSSKLRDKTKSEEQREAEKRALKEKELKEKGEFEKLLEQKESELSKLKNDYSTERKRSLLRTEALKAGAVDVDVIEKIVDLSDLDVDDSGSFKTELFSEKISSLKSEKPFLFGSEQKKDIGTSGANPSLGKMVVKRSELSNGEFFKEHEKEISEHMRKGTLQITEDLGF